MHQLPESIDTLRAFRAAFGHVAEESYSWLVTPIKYVECYDENGKAMFDADIADAISASLALIGAEEPPEAGDWIAPLYEIAAEFGAKWVEMPE